MMKLATLAALLLLIVAPADAQDPAGVLQAGKDAGVAIVALIGLPITARYVYLIFRDFLNDKKAERAASQAWITEMALRYGKLATEIESARVQDEKDAKHVGGALSTLGIAVTQGKTSADTLAADVRKLMDRIEPAIAAMETIKRDIDRRDAKDRDQDAETAKLAKALDGFTTEFQSLKTKIEENHHEKPPLLPAPADRRAVVGAEYGTWSNGQRAIERAAADQHPGANGDTA